MRSFSKKMLKACYSLSPIIVLIHAFTMTPAGNEINAASSLQKVPETMIGKKKVKTSGEALHFLSATSFIQTF